MHRTELLCIVGNYCKSFARFAGVNQTYRSKGSPPPLKNGPFGKKYSEISKNSPHRKIEKQNPIFKKSAANDIYLSFSVVS